MKRFLASLTIGALLFASLTGCATYKYAKTPPATPATLGWLTASETPAKMSSFPVGTYYDNQHRMAFNGYQKGQTLGLLFGVAGVLLADQANKSTGKDKFGASTQLIDIDIAKETRLALERQVQSQGCKRIVFEPRKEAMLEISPYALVNFDKQGQSRLYAVLNVKLVTATDETLWSARYFAAAKGRHPYMGDNSWIGGGLLNPAIEEALDRCAWAMIQDIEGRFSDRTKVTAKGSWAWSEDPILEWRAIKIAETDDFVVLRFVIGDAMTFAGTHVVEKSSVSLTPGNFSLPGGL